MVHLVAACDVVIRINTSDAASMSEACAFNADPCPARTFGAEIE
jgi:hypothetical protein